MNEQTSRTERKVLLISAVGNLVIGVVGILFAVFSHSQAILLDGLFNLTYFASVLFALKVAKMVLQKCSVILFLLSLRRLQGDEEMVKSLQPTFVWILLIVVATAAALNTDGRIKSARAGDDAGELLD